MTLRRTPAERLPVDLLAMKMEARYLEEEGNVREALALYRDILNQLEPKPLTDQMLPFYLKVAELARHTGDASLASTTLLKGADRFAKVGDARSVGELCLQILRIDPGHKDVYAQFARRMLDYRHAEPARQLMLDYARRARSANLAKVLTQMERWPKDDLQRLLTDFLNRIVPEDRRRRRSSDHRRRPSDLIREVDSLPEDGGDDLTAPGDDPGSDAEPEPAEFSPDPAYVDHEPAGGATSEPIAPVEPPLIEAVTPSVVAPADEHEHESSDTPIELGTGAEASDLVPATIEFDIDEPPITAEPEEAPDLEDAVLPTVAAEDTTPMEAVVVDEVEDVDETVTVQVPSDPVTQPAPAPSAAAVPSEAASPATESEPVPEPAEPGSGAAIVVDPADDVEPVHAASGSAAILTDPGEELPPGGRRRAPVVLLVPFGLAAAAGILFLTVGRSADSATIDETPAAVTVAAPSPRTIDNEGGEAVRSMPPAAAQIGDPEEPPPTLVAPSVASESPDVPATDDAPSESDGNPQPAIVGERAEPTPVPTPAPTTPAAVTAHLEAQPDAPPETPAAAEPDLPPTNVETDNTLPTAAVLEEPTAVVDGLPILEIAPLDTPTGRGYRILQLASATDTLQLTVVSLGSGGSGQVGRVRVRESEGSSIGTTRYAQYLVTARAALPAAEIESLLSRLVEISPN